VAAGCPRTSSAGDGGASTASPATVHDPPGWNWLRTIATSRRRPPTITAKYPRTVRWSLEPAILPMAAGSEPASTAR
jgi:hypothetical protein